METNRKNFARTKVKTYLSSHKDKIKICFFKFSLFYLSNYELYT